MSESRFISLEELEALSAQSAVDCPKLSEKAGRPITVQIRSIEPLDLLKLYDLPMDEINSLVASGDQEKLSAAVEEQVSAFDMENYQKMIQGVLELGIVTPEPTPAALKALAPDSLFIFGEIMKLTNPERGAEDAARFRSDG